jgi:hypothetical protein
MTFKAYLATAFCLVALFSTASANPITLSFSGSLDCQWPDPTCGIVFIIYPAWSSGEITSGSGTIFEVTGPHGQSAQVSAGSLLFSTAPSYDVQVEWLDQASVDIWGNSGPGGSFSVSGSVPGLGNGTLLSGTFLSASWFAYFHAGEFDLYDSAIQIAHVNPALLEGFGLQPDLTFVGELRGSLDDSYGPWNSQVSIDLIATPEPSAVVLASLFLLLSGLAYLRRPRTRNCG